MDSKIINILLSSFPGLNIPKTLAFPIASTASFSELYKVLTERLPILSHQSQALLLTTTSNKQLHGRSEESIRCLLDNENDDFLSLRLSARLCGGKGGFGSQLRAAGGRMSSKNKKKNQAEANGSSRNLDGRRLRTVTEAKALAEYLAIKPDMEKKEKELRRKRWEQVVELAEKREEEMKSGSRGTIDGKWAEDKEEAGEKTREAVRLAMQSGAYTDSLSSSSVGSSSSVLPDDTKAMAPSSASSTEEVAISSKKTSHSPKTFIGFDEDDEFLSDTSDEADDSDNGSSQN